MFLNRMAGGLVFASGAGLSKLGIADESWLLLSVGLSAAVWGVSWFAKAWIRSAEAAPART